MITKITVTDNKQDKYLYDNEVKILLSMLNNDIKKNEIKNKFYYIVKTGNNTAKIKISKIIPKLIFFKDYKTLTILNIKYN